MIITENEIEQVEQELLKTTNIENLYDPTYYNIVKQILLTGENGNICLFKAFTYKDSLRFSVLTREKPCYEMIDWLIDEIKRIINNNKKSLTLLWYSQTNGFSTEFIDKLSDYTDPYKFLLFRLNKDCINTDVDMKGLIAQKCTANMIDTCIDIMEDVFTPFPDSPGSFRDDKERITADFLDEDSGTTLFYKGNDLVGFCGHKKGHFTEVAVRKEYQGKGFGEIIVRSVLKSVREMGYDAELTTGHYNHRAILLYQKVGFQKIYESIRVTISGEKNI